MRGIPYWTPVVLLTSTFLSLPSFAQLEPNWNDNITTLQRNKQSAEQALPNPHRPLTWGDVNFVHTTDIHNWILGHQKKTWPEPSYSGDIGDLLSFLTHLRNQANLAGQDLLLIDSGDHHDGPGIGSLSSEAADQVDEWISQLDYDVLAIGNHELYKYDVTYDVWKSVHEKNRWKGRYLTSNANITVDDAGMQPIGDRYTKFKTKQGRNVTAFGVLYAFSANPNGTFIQPSADLVKESWFLDAIAERPDFFVLAGHMAIRGEGADFDIVLGAIRALHPDVPVFIFGGHTHIRDCLQLDGRSMSLESGRYMESVGWMSANFTASGDMDIHRRYFDQNRRTYKYHVGSKTEFDTLPGLMLSLDIKEAHASLNLSAVLGHVPEDYFLARVSFREPNSVLTKLMYDVLPSVVVDPTIDTPGRQRLYVANSGSQRFDVLKGPFTVDDSFVVSPFDNGFVLYTINAKVAKQVSKRMNDNGASRLLPISSSDGYEQWMQDQWKTYQQEELRHQQKHQQATFGSTIEKTMGYVTKDQCRGAGDDTLHVPLPRGDFLPDYVDSPVPEDLDDDELVDAVIMEFFTEDFLRAVNELDPSAKLTEKDAKRYAKSVPKISDVWGLYAERFWN